ncbi:hypothetical protein CGC20_7300 [Leishmania donovani]|uniref:Uncharacterized protein n=3 Tax=Leishmania donovani species complex TaxID=38574 RepID=A4I5B3_LEIIN|nr:conserved hypothetical protein [Leishmania infantum JPCM5]TPP43426.1 hypothetical protein CGC20_7300 [Leishmania donovani]CAC9512524.1 hypothetical_protein_-_conserved [Leishmania infantum]CAM69981.1 conserved hypothetical protein [Leishmania infantum JPCM5]SUZ43900.1 hypothetical_protein_-_conserved [Leishmania infantum]|eukprot:XP_001466932.1 conserved hypothetical protein [Leishmania infantum JPCM5]
MNSHNRNIAIVSSAAYGAVLCCGMLFFLLDTREKHFYMHPSKSVAVFSVLWFSFAPSILFTGATIPWLCAAYGSEVAALVFAIVPGCIFVLLGVVWLVVYLFHERNSYFVGVQHSALWGGNIANLEAAIGGSAARRYVYTAADPAMVGVAKAFSVADSALPRPHGALTASFSASGFEDVDAVITPASQWRGYTASRENNIPRGAGGWAADRASSASWYRGPLVLPTHSVDQLEPPYVVQERSLGTHYVA